MHQSCILFNYSISLKIFTFSLALTEIQLCASIYIKVTLTKLLLSVSLLGGVDLQTCHCLLCRLQTGSKSSKTALPRCLRAGFTLVCSGARRVSCRLPNKGVWANSGMVTYTVDKISKPRSPLWRLSSVLEHLMRAQDFFRASEAELLAATLHTSALRLGRVQSLFLAFSTPLTQ